MPIDQPRSHHALLERRSRSLPPGTRPTGLHLHRLARETWGRHMHIRQSACRNHVLLGVLAGHGRFEDAVGRAARLEPGCIGIHLQGRWRVDLVQDAQLEVVLMSCSGATADRLLQPCAGPDGQVIPQVQSQIDMLLALQAYACNGGDAEACRILAHGLIRSLPPAATSGSSPSRDSWQRAMQMLGQRYLDLHTVEAWAETCHISCAQLHRLCRRHTGLSPGRLLLQSRMEHAQELLAGDLPVATIASLCGYDDNAVFARAFKRIVGCSPRNFRKQLLET